MNTIELIKNRFEEKLSSINPLDACLTAPGGEDIALGATAMSAFSISESYRARIEKGRFDATQWDDFQKRELAQAIFETKLNGVREQLADLADKGHSLSKSSYNIVGSGDPDSLQIETIIDLSREDDLVSFLQRSIVCAKMTQHDAHLKNFVDYKYNVLRNNVSKFVGLGMLHPDSLESVKAKDVDVVFGDVFGLGAKGVGAYVHGRLLVLPHSKGLIDRYYSHEGGHLYIGKFNHHLLNEIAAQHTAEVFDGIRGIEETSIQPGAIYGNHRSIYYMLVDNSGGRLTMKDLTIPFSRGGIIEDYSHILDAKVDSAFKTRGLLKFILQQFNVSYHGSNAGSAVEASAIAAKHTKHAVESFLDVHSRRQITRL